MARYDVVRKAKDGSAVKVGTVRTRRGQPVELELRVPVSGRFSLVPEQVGDDEVTVSRLAPMSRTGTVHRLP